MRDSTLADVKEKWDRAKHGTWNQRASFAVDNVDYLFEVIRLQQLVIEDMRNRGDSFLLDEIAQLKRLIQQDIDTAAATYAARNKATR